MLVSDTGHLLLVQCPKKPGPPHVKPFELPSSEGHMPEYARFALRSNRRR